MTKICVTKPFTTTKILTILADVKNNDDICSCSLVIVRLQMVAGLHQKSRPSGVMLEKIELLERLLDEKERLIKVLMKQ